jgi:hypothetical protein
MVTCGGQATVPMVHAVARVTPVPYAEIVASIASRSAGPATRANIDEFTETTSRAITEVGGAEAGKAIIILNPAEPPLLMRGDEAQVGFHAHRNLGVGEANTLLAVCAGAVQVDGSLRAFGAGSGNAQTEVIAALLERLGISTGIDIAALLDVAEEIAALLQPTVPVVDRDAVTLGLAGVYSSFLKHARNIGARYGVAPHQVLRAAGERRLVGGQEDLLVDIAVELAEAGGPTTGTHAD